MPQPVGPILDGLGCQATLADGDLVAGAVVLLKVVDTDGTVRLTTCWSEGMSWIERLGMLRASEQGELPGDGRAPAQDPE